MAVVPGRGSFRGLFVGVNRYRFPDIDHLKSAVWDAQALHALFCDNLGETATLIVDEEATRARLVDESHPAGHPRGKHPWTPGLPQPARKRPSHAPGRVRRHGRGTPRLRER